MAQNTSPAVMSQRREPHDSLDDFPTPPWATRALCEWLGRERLHGLTCREPAANRMHMARPLAEYFGTVEVSDVHDYGFGYPVRDYLFPDPIPNVHWTITNPPYRLAREFIYRASNTSTHGCAFLLRTNFLEGVERYNMLFRDNRPSHVLQFSERVVIHKGKLSERGSTATAYCWVIWDKAAKHYRLQTHLEWIMPSRRSLERASDYPEGDQ